LNWIIGEKIAMVSHKANATRKRANIIAMHNNSQIIFVDTPGIHQREKLINQFMLNEAIKAIGDCDLILFLAPIHDNLEHYEEFLRLNKKSVPHIVMLTKNRYSSKRGFI
jgi:GTP-binding protein Era